MEEKHEQKKVEVHVKSLKTGERVHFEVPESATLQQVWDEANSKLHESRLPDDTFRCADGEDLTARVQETLAQLHQEKVCVNRHFEIKGASGGADAGSPSAGGY